MNAKPLSHLETLILLAVIRCGEKAYGLAIMSQIKEITGREYVLGTVRNTLVRMEKKHLVASWLADQSADRGGRPRQYFKVEPAGHAAILAAKKEVESMS